MNLITFSSLFVLLFLPGHLMYRIDGSRVLELTDRFVELQKEGMWFVMFYAPWCAYCKRLEPVWNLVAQSLHRTNIRVARVDCTRFTAVANAFSINGFPTIIFIKDNIKFVFKGDRNKEELVNFGIRLSGPPVQQLTQPESMGLLKSTNDLFFMYVGDFKGHLWDVYMDVAERQQANGFFYCAPHYLVKDHVSDAKLPSILVFKENYNFSFEGSHEENLNDSVSKWVNEERFLTFPKITRGNIHQFFQIDKYIALVVLEENKLEELAPDMLEFRDMVESVVRKHREKYHKYFQFGWVGSPDLANSIAMAVLPLPHLIVVNSSTQHHHLPEEDPSQLTPQELITFLDQVHNQSARVLGGKAWYVRLYRRYFEGKSTLIQLWQGNPVLTAVLFGLPLGFLSLICYSIFCADIMDADDDEEAEELSHEKNE